MKNVYYCPQRLFLHIVLISAKSVHHGDKKWRGHEGIDLQWGAGGDVRQCPACLLPSARPLGGDKGMDDAHKSTVQHGLRRLVRTRKHVRERAESGHLHILDAELQMMQHARDAARFYNGVDKGAIRLRNISESPHGVGGKLRIVHVKELSKGVQSRKHVVARWRWFAAHQVGERPGGVPKGCQLAGDCGPFYHLDDAWHRAAAEKRIAVSRAISGDVGDAPNRLLPCVDRR
mmetsp:Transcript_31289/g.101069  ORF Transcript_31289/g.101069 Transcript_31289/m.101069 type:complete len:232 (-) Transcript_31289:562-1257(-)|eukprot:scaffold19118_cov129-Isochrysis_galbana.AAC.2